MTNTPVLVVQSSQSNGLLLKYSVTPSLAASRTSGHLVGILDLGMERINSIDLVP